MFLERENEGNNEEDAACKLYVEDGGHNGELQSRLDEDSLFQGLKKISFSFNNSYNQRWLASQFF